MPVVSVYSYNWTYHRLLHIRVAVNSHALPIYKKNRIASLLCIFETTIYYIYLYSWCTIKNNHLAKWSIFCQMIDVFFRLYNPFPPRPKTTFKPLVYLYNDVQLSKGHLGSRGGASTNKLKDTSFIFSMTNITIFKYISYACAEEILQSFGNEGHLYP